LSRRGSQSIVGENAIIRATAKYPVRIGDSRARWTKCGVVRLHVGRRVFLATDVTVFQGARVRKQAEVGINGVVHVKSVLRERPVVPINRVAVGDPAQILTPNEHERILAVQKPLNFPLEAYGVERASDCSVDMKEITQRLADSAGEHRRDKPI
jgi:carbonic anhydrase/acetyltransferase-like protein (isoleucine patch superfamily)